MTEQFTKSNIPIKPVYTPQDVAGLDVEKQLGQPGAFPYTRGIRPAGAWRWIQRELSGQGTPGTSNEQLKYLISKGQSGIDVIADAPTMALMDPDHPLAGNAIGTQGVSLCTLQDFRDLWADLPLGSLTVSNSISSFIIRANSRRVARILAISSKKSMPQLTRMAGKPPRVGRPSTVLYRGLRLFLSSARQPPVTPVMRFNRVLHPYDAQVPLLC